MAVIQDHLENDACSALYEMSRQKESQEKTRL
jgi:hypothetical protein